MTRRLEQLGAVAFVLMLSVAGCVTDKGAVVAPDETAQLVTRHSRAAVGDCTPEMIICDSPGTGDVSAWVDDGYEEVYAAEATGSSSNIDSSLEGTVPACPSSAYGNVVVTVSVPSPQGTISSVRFTTTGTWVFLGYVGPSAGEYIWPAGWWPAVDGSGIEVSVNTCHANCYLQLNLLLLQTYRISPTRFFGVNARYPRRRGYVFPSSGGSPPEQCQFQYIFVEIKADGGTWQTIWEGWVWVCD